MVFVINAVLLVVAIVATRMSFRVFGRIAARTGSRHRRVAICGAGSRGQLLVREMLADAAWDRYPVAFFDDDPGKRSIRILGVPVRGGLDHLDGALEKLGIEEVVISSATIDEAREAQVRAICEARGIPVHRLFLEIR